MITLKNYNVTIEISLILSLLLILAAFQFSPEKLKYIPVKTSVPEIINIENITPTEQSLPPDLPRPVLPIISLSDDIQDIVMEDVSIDYNKGYTKLPDLTKDRIVEDERRIFKVVEELPTPVGGMKAIQERLFYPEFAKKIGIEGRVVIAAVVDENENVIKTKVLKSIFPDLDNIACKAVSETKFFPGKQRGKPVKVEVKIPVNFKLK
jgi:protein TonB